MYSTTIGPPLTENVQTKFNPPIPAAAAVPVVSTVAPAEKKVDHDEPAVATVPWPANSPVIQQVDALTAGEIVRKTNSPSMRHAVPDKDTGTVCATDAPKLTAPVNDVVEAPIPKYGVMVIVLADDVVVANPPNVNL